MTRAPWCCSRAGSIRRRRSRSRARAATSATRSSFDYGQRHRAELAAARRVSAALARGSASRDASVARRVRRLGAHRQEHRRARARRRRHSGHVRAGAQYRVSRASRWRWPKSSTPTRSSSASTRSTTPGYPDCRPEYIAAFQNARAARDEARRRRRHADDRRAARDACRKPTSFGAARELGVDYSLTVSCYQADEEGRACGRCDSCRLRREGFAAAGVADPTRYR